MPNPTRSREKPAARSWKFREPGHAIVGYLNNADIGFQRCHEAVHEKVEPRQHTLTNKDGTKQTFTISDPESQAQWAENRIGHRLLAIQDEIIPLLRDWRTYVMRDAAKLHLTAEFTARLDEVEHAFMRLLTRRDFLTRRPLIRGAERRLRVNHDLLHQRLNRIFDAIDRADTLIKFFEKPEPPPGGKAPVRRAVKSPQTPGMTTSQLAERLNCKPKSISRTFKRAGVSTPKRGEHGRQYSVPDLQRVAKWCLAQSSSSYIARGKAIQTVLESARPKQT